MADWRDALGAPSDTSQGSDNSTSDWRSSIGSDQPPPSRTNLSAPAATLENVPGMAPGEYPSEMYTTFSPNASLVQNAILAPSMAKAGYGLAKGITGGIKNFFSATPDLLNAGIKPSTVLKMTPKGQNPAEFGTALQDSLNQAGAIGKDASDTWQKMNALKQATGQNIGTHLQAISKAAGPNAITVDADTALRPVLEGWVEHADGATTATRAMAKPFEQIYTSLAKQAATNGGKLSLDHIRNAMEEIGPMTHVGKPEMQEAMSRLYSALANARDGMVQTVAQQAGNPQLAQNLLNANANYSKYMRLMPDINRAAAAFPIKQEVSSFQTYKDFAEKALGIGGGVYALTRGIKKLTGP